MASKALKPEQPVDSAKTDGGDAKTSLKDEVPAKKGIMSKLKEVWTGLALDVPTVLTMAKGGLPPTIALSIYQADSVATTFSTLGYLVAIISIIGTAIMPRAKFVQTMATNLISLCLGAAVALLVIFSSVKARQHTTPHSNASGTQSPTPGATLVEYNSSASAVCAVWFFFQIYVVNTTRAKLPQFQLPSIMYSIFVIVACTYSPMFGTMAAGISFVKRLLETFLTGFAIAAGVNVFIFPLTCRKIVFKECAGYIAGLQGALKAHQSYIQSLEDPTAFGESVITGVDGKGAKTAEAMKVKAAIAAITALHGKLQGDLPFAKREVALGKLDAGDLKQMNKMLRNIMLPTVGLGAIMDIFERIAFFHGWTRERLDQGLNLERQQSRVQVLNEWSENIKILHDPFASIIEAMVEGLEHVALQLQLKKRPKPKGSNAKQPSADTEDVEANANATKPGEAGFADYFEQKSKDFNGGKQQTLRDWCHQHGIELGQHFFDHPAEAPFSESKAVRDEKQEQRDSNQRQLYLLLYMEFLLYSASQAILTFVRFADEIVESGKLSKSRLIVPGAKQMRKWVFSLVKSDEGSREDGQGLDLNETTQVDLGQAFQVRKDPEHLPPTSKLQQFGDAIRAVPRFLRSAESAFGFRVASATMCIAIISFLHNTSTFFVQNRLLWATIMVAISMTPTAGQSLYSFFLRIFGTIVAMILAFLAYYIPDGKTPGILVFVWLFTSMGWYIPLKKPHLSVVGIISIVTMTLIIGYTLEVRKIGQTLATSNGQTFLPIYELGPYRLATVAGGLFVAFIWTIIPYPISEHSQLRQGVGGALYLLANYYSIIHETVLVRVRNEEGDLDSPTDPGQRLAKMKYSNFLKWEIPIGGKFPKQQYDALIQSTEHIFNYISLIGYASTTFATPEDDNNEWQTSFRRLIGSVNATSHEVTSLLALLSASITNGQPLPPYLKLPSPYGLSTKLEALDHDLLSVRHIGEPGYAAFAVMQVSSRCIIHELYNLLTAVKEIVGELDFSFHIVSTAAASHASSETLASKESSKDKSD